MRSYQEELAALDHAVEEEDFSITLLTSLPESWNAFISSIDTADLKDSYKLIARVLQEDIWQKDKTSNRDTMLVAQFHKKKYNPNVTCFGCGKCGHIVADCEDGSGKKESTSKLKQWKKWKGKAQNNGSHANVAKEDTEDTFSFVANDTALAALDSSSWLADSGCSSHIVKDKSLFVDYIKTPGHKIKGVGESAGLGRGTIKLIFKDGKRFTSVTLKNAIHCPTAPYNLISLSQMTDARATLTFSGDEMFI